MSDPYKYSDNQTERFNKEREWNLKMQNRASSYNSDKLARENATDAGAESATLKAIISSYEILAPLGRAVRKSEDQTELFDSLRVDYNLLRVFGCGRYKGLSYDTAHHRLIHDGKYVEETEDLITLCKKDKEWKGRLPKISEIWQFSKHCSFNPVQDYLRGLNEQRLRHEKERKDPAYARMYGQSVPKDPQKTIDDFSEKVLGVEDPLGKLFVRRTLVGAVARAMNPGCQFDTVLVLVGPQGLGKSRFFEHLFGSDNYGLIYEGSGDKDWRLAMHSVWCAEMGEIDGHLRKKDSSQVKSIITEAEDKFRVPYGKEITARKRPCILVGTTNQDHFLVDTTGNRRFWAVKVTKQIDQKEIRGVRHQVWAAAYHIYSENLEPYYIDYSEKELREALNERNLQHLDEHPWEDTIRLIVESMDVNGRFQPDEEKSELLNRGRLLQLGNYVGRYLQTRDILELLGKESCRQTKADSNRVSQSMRGLHNFQLAVREGRKVWVPELP